ncbi:SCP-like extracellular [Nodosilinea sp. FACHB-13]|nr:SCP-like extracellular [Nodosilinea sp. FACHB-13]
MSDSLLEAHNLYRFEVGVPPLEWSESLANSSQAWADRLSSTNTFAHSDGNGYGENLWQGTAGAYSLADMVRSWGDEQEYFIPDAAFPNLSTTGNWTDVGHYTQIVWRDTTEVGCGLATGNGQDVLVCRYSPPGNYQGQKPF